MATADQRSKEWSPQKSVLLACARAAAASGGRAEAVIEWAIRGS
jgi:hypothetical protein